jgi:hypothetical protein
MSPILVGALAALVVLVLVLVVRHATRWHGWWGFWYRRYLRSRRWEYLSLRVKERDDWTCQECGVKQEIINWHDTYGRYIGATAEPKMNAHHLPGTYHSWIWYALCLPERKRNLITVCRKCHEWEHGQEV